MQEHPAFWRRKVGPLLATAAITGGSMLVAAGTADAATVAVFSGGALTVTGDNLNNTITISRNAAGNILVNGGAIAVNGGNPTVANTTQISVFGLHCYFLELCNDCFPDRTTVIDRTEQQNTADHQQEPVTYIPNSKDNASEEYSDKAVPT